jgi:alkanesulfonate monooxygenase SsuD/methylene tetrahydromethanopterin reductase-like flavin-dependent oxidoreductase (luciferase family)
MSAPISFGFGMISGQRVPSEPRSNTELYRDLVALCRLAEDLGFDSAWLSEHHFVDDGYMPSLLTTAAAIAVTTAHLQIGTGILTAPLHDPVRLAEDAAVVDLLSSGRLILGLGAGYRDEEFAGLGRELAGLGTVLESTVGTLRRAWSGEAIRGGPGRAEVIVTPRPDRDSGPPIWLGARKPDAIRRAGRLADGFLAARVSPAEFGDQLAVLDAEIDVRQRRREQVAVGVHCPVFAWPDDTAWERVEPALHYVEWKYQDMVREPYGSRSGPAVPPLIDDTTRATMRKGALIGPPSDVAAAIRAYHDRCGSHPFHFVARLYWPGMDPSQQRDALRVFVGEVIPRVLAS